ncbi:hypothetical protein H5U35_07435, partial [Candidatus Aerophobetes bacterium]|nr:hypothetical protein [Candidatus Aerophobetes bacterium]
MRWRSLKVVGFAGIVVALVIGLSCASLAQPTITTSPKGVAATASNSTGGVRISASGLDSSKYYKVLVRRPDATLTETIDYSAVAKHGVTSFTLEYFINSGDFGTKDLRYPGRYQTELWETDSAGTPQTFVTATYFYVVDVVRVTPTPDAVMGASSGSVNINIRVETDPSTTWPASAPVAPVVGESFDVQVNILSGTTVLASASTWLNFTSSIYATNDPNQGGTDADISLSRDTDPGRYDIGAVQTSNPPSVAHPGVFGTTGHDYLYVFHYSDDKAKIEVDHPNALLQGQSENTATTFDITMGYGTAADAITGETITIKVGDQATPNLFGWNNTITAKTVTLTAVSATSFATTDVNLAQTPAATQGTYTLHAYENSSTYPQFADDSSAIHPYLFIIDSLNVTVDPPDTFHSSSSNETTFDVSAVGTFDDPANGASPYTGTVAISLDSASVYISPATTTLTLVLSGGTLASYDTTLVYNADLGTPTTPRVNFVIWENWISPESDENPVILRSGFPGDQFELTGHPYIYVIEGPFHFYVDAPDAFLAGSADTTTFDAWVEGSISGATSGDTITVLVNASGASTMVSAATAVTLIYGEYDGTEKFATYDVPLYIGAAASPGRYLLYAQKNEVGGEYWETVDDGTDHPYLYVLSPNQGYISIKDCYPDVFVEGSDDTTLIDVMWISSPISTASGKGNTSPRSDDTIKVDVRDSTGGVSADNVVLRFSSGDSTWVRFGRWEPPDTATSLYVSASATGNSKYELSFYESGSDELINWANILGHPYVYVFNKTNNIFTIKVSPPDVFQSGSADTTTFEISVTCSAATTGDTIHVLVFDEEDETVSAGTVELIATGETFASTGVTLNIAASTQEGEKELDVIEKKGDYSGNYGKEDDEFALDLSTSATSHPYIFVVDQFTVNVGDPNAFVYDTSPDTTTLNITRYISGASTGRTGTILVQASPASVTSYISVDTTGLITLVVDGSGNLATNATVTLNSGGTTPQGKWQMALYESASDQFNVTGHDYLYVLGDSGADNTQFNIEVTGPDALVWQSADSTTIAVSTSSGTISRATAGDTIRITVAASGDQANVSQATVTLVYDSTAGEFVTTATVYLNVTANASSGRKALYAYEKRTDGNWHVWENASGNHDYLYLIPVASAVQFHIDNLEQDAFKQGELRTVVFDMWTDAISGQANDTIKVS